MVIFKKIKSRYIFSVLAIGLQFLAFGQREIIDLKDWKFSRTDSATAYTIEYDDSHWENVKVPHDWAIYGPFDKNIDKQVVKIEQNKETIASEKTGRTGALPFIGVGWYRTTFDLSNTEDKQILLSFDGAMSNAQVFVNGKKIGSRAYGYSYFYFDITNNIRENSSNTIAVRLENLPFSSRWYPGAGLYRKVNLHLKNKTSFEHWGHTITTPKVSDTLATVSIKSLIQGKNTEVVVAVKNAADKIIAQFSAQQGISKEVHQQFEIQSPMLWSPDQPYLYTAEITLFKDGVKKDQEHIRFGIRDLQFSRANGFELNGVPTKIKGVCLHHDLGPLGTAVNKAALKRQLKIMKDMGCNAIRSAHNMPALEQVELCDEMGLLFLAESFDEWKKPKVKNGYNLYFDKWAEDDVVNLVRATKNHPSIFMWSAGNEVPDQWGEEGVKRLQWLQDIFHREDPTRPVTVGMDQVKAVMDNGFGAILDIPGLNYRVHLYEEAYNTFPQGFILGSETASTVSSRGVYKFPVVSGQMKTYSDLQCSSYDLEYCSWSNLPEDDFVAQDDNPWVLGEFVWTGFDYLGEPTPYDSFWPSRSSYFGLCDLAGLPKDRYYLYRSRWNTKEETLHLLPHWNWEGREGQTTPIFVYTSYPSAEVFINGKSQGIQHKNNSSKLNRYRLMWMNTVYEPGELKVVAYDNQGIAVAEKTTRTAGSPDHIVLSPDKSTIQADGEDIVFVTATVVDKNGTPCPTATNTLEVSVEGFGEFKAICNGDPTSLELFHKPTMALFSGQLVILIKSITTPGPMNINVYGKGLPKVTLSLESTTMD